MRLMCNVPTQATHISFSCEIIQLTKIKYEKCLTSKKLPLDVSLKCDFPLFIREIYYIQYTYINLFIKYVVMIII